MSRSQMGALFSVRALGQISRLPIVISKALFIGMLMAAERGNTMAETAGASAR